jgi:hypothetical protein
VYGEWCGGNIQRGVGLCDLPRMYVVLDCCVVATGCEDVDGEPQRRYIHPSVWCPFFKNCEQGVRNVHEFQTFSLTVHFDATEIAQQALVDITNKVEADCPVARHIKNEIKGHTCHQNTGEGVVWTGTAPDGRTYRFKVKGSKHSSTRVTTLAAVDVEKAASLKQFVANCVTENRLQQGLEQVFTSAGRIPTRNGKDVTTFISWVKSDVLKEEIDTMSASDLKKKDVLRMVGSVSAKWFVERM